MDRSKLLLPNKTPIRFLLAFSGLSRISWTAALISCKFWYGGPVRESPRDRGEGQGGVSMDDAISRDGVQRDSCPADSCKAMLREKRLPWWRLFTQLPFAMRRIRGAVHNRAHASKGDFQGTLLY